MAAGTRGGGRGRRGPEEEEVPPPPQHPSMADLLATQNRILEQLVRNQGAGGGHARGGLADFQRTQPATFDRS